MTRWIPRWCLEIVIVLFVAALWLVPLVPEINGFPFFRGAKYSDLLISHWPNAHFLRQSLLKWGQIPLWNPITLGGAPFAADPLSGLWYPPNWLTYVMPISLAFNVLFWAHLAWAGWGMWLLSRKEGVGWQGALIAAVAFSGTPKFIAHIGLGHLGLVSAVSWTPWILYLAHRFVDEIYSGKRSWIRWGMMAGAALGILTIADPRWTIPAGLLALAYSLYRATLRHRKVEPTDKTSLRGRLLMAPILYGTSAIAIAACLLLPLFEYVSLSTRTGISITDQTQLQIPISNLLGVILPIISQPEWVAYLGVTICYLAIVAWISKAPGTGFWSVVVVAAWVFAIGDQTPLFSIFNAIVPGADLLRVPARMLFLASFGIAMLCGKGVDWFLKNELESPAVKKVRLSTIGIVLAVLLFICGLWFLTGSIQNIFIGSGVVALLMTFWVWLNFKYRIPQTYRALAWVMLIVADLLWVNAQLLEVRPKERVLNERIILADKLASAPQEGRIFSPSYSLPYQTAVQAGLEMVDGINPLQLRAFRTFMADATGFPSVGYSVTLPPYPNGDPSQPWDVEIDALELGQLNVAYILSEYPIASNDLILMEKGQGEYLYQNEMVRPRAWIQDSQDLSSTTWRAIDSLMWSPNGITIQAKGPGTLVLSEIAYPGWKVTVDGANAEWQTLDNLLRAVVLSTGDHEVVFNFQPWTVYLGCGITLVFLLALVGVWMRR
ncbi:MAG TPA: YfhO family protein [Anaerolineae bacterium]|nr:YfhO family protein [Anaerolineae bacterium]